MAVVLNGERVRRWTGSTAHFVEGNDIHARAHERAKEMRDGRRREWEREGATSERFLERASKWCGGGARGVEGRSREATPRLGRRSPARESRNDPAHLSTTASTNAGRKRENCDHISSRNKPRTNCGNKRRHNASNHFGLIYFCFSLTRDTLHKANDLPAANVGMPSILCGVEFSTMLRRIFDGCNFFELSKVDRRTISPLSR
ncbi:uncharacterized protein LOC105427080 [Pogonomyrmex barbatus]|uniref:Uncharacterized protein LOC105427080 n=1 Tax=Pogonomyrmex barbatus TaxID=144034 RepID=A0A6I9WY79_9HYME|nr:uncharacterized protein LOC105427080 [Pogonomyrmex barbatus]